MPTTTPSPRPTGAVDPENGETAPGADTPPQTAAAAETAAHPSGDDGTDKVLHTTDVDAFGPIEIPDTVAGSKDADGKTVKYTIDREGVLVAGAHVKHVRDLAKHCQVALRSSKPKSD